MHIKFLAIAIHSICVSSCVGASSQAVTPVRQGYDPMSESAYRAALTCGIDQPISDLVTLGSDQRFVWEQVFRHIKDDDVVQIFLDDWRVGDNYYITEANCFMNHKPKIFLSLRFVTDRLGQAIIDAELWNGQIIAYRLFLSSQMEVID